jgi:hypothetical protein
VPIAAGYAIGHLVSTSTIATVQVTAIVLGHLVAAVGAHDRAVRLLPGKTTVHTQYPLVAAMMALTMGAVERRTPSR